MRRRAFATIALAGLALLGWAAPAIVAGSRLPEELRRFGVELQLSQVRPAWPFGFRAQTAALRTADAALQLGDLRTLWSPGGLSGTASLGTGAIEVVSSRDARAGRVYAHDIPLEAVELLRVKGVKLRGSLTGAARWQEDLRFSARIERGTATLLGGLIGARTDHLRVQGQWSPDKRVAQIERLEAFGPSFDLTGKGIVRASGEVELQLEVQRIEERLMGTLRLLGIAVPRQFPARYALVGPWQKARLELLP